jgi:hypothetical protein
MHREPIITWSLLIGGAGKVANIYFMWIISVYGGWNLPDLFLQKSLSDVLTPKV